MLSSKAAPFIVTDGFKSPAWGHYIADYAAVGRLSPGSCNHAVIVL
jgi:hypothetical protein